MDDSAKIKKLQDEIQDLKAQRTIGIKFRDDIITVLSTAGHGMWQWSKESNLLLFDNNESFWGDDLGYSPGEYTLDLDFCVQKMDLQCQQELAEAVGFYFSGKKKFLELECRLKTKSGDWAWFWTRGISTDFGKDGFPIRMLGIYNNTTEKNKFEEELRESEKKYREILEGLNDAAYRMSLPDGKYEYVSQAAKNIFGYSAEECLNNPMLIKEIIHPDYEKYFADKWADIMNGIVPKTYEYKIVDPEEKERWIFQSNTPVYDNENNIIAIEGLCRDITTFKQVELEKEQLIKSLEETLAEVQKLSGLLPICASCKKIRDDKGYWNQIETFIEQRSEAQFSHGICEECAEKLYSNTDWYKKRKQKQK